MTGTTLAALIATALLLSCLHGFRDAPHLLAASVSTRALTPRVALVLVCVMGAAGALLGTAVATTIAYRLVDLTPGAAGLTAVLAGTVAALLWSALSRRLRLPGSTSQALLGGVLGAVLMGSALADTGTVRWGEVLGRVVLPMLLAPVAALVGAWVLMIAILWIFRDGRPRRVQHGFRIAQSVSAAGAAMGFGLQNAQKTMGVVLLGLVAAGSPGPGGDVPWWVRLTCATALVVGTALGGLRLMSRTRRRILEADPPRAFAAEASASVTLLFASLIPGVPLSPTQVTAPAVLGAGSTRRRRWARAVRSGASGTRIAGHLLTPLAAAGTGAVLCLLLLPLTG
ncbi:inorganic phosphate transporter [Streptomyces sp. ST2-7A]|uniref:inorganic phosphate transporter n=1 Tax=Streptomyces sp. ST2-7A TaxID=2907214 RepID=UPI001F2E5EF9|nr:inorganic phosphate transporter [Streptomyces sp. ST2-7A]MCE7080277.1 inorganic phosphate transporter [Streptomyces sp. ST2-7A]